MQDHRYENQQLLKTKPLKEVYPDPEIRKKFAEQKLSNKAGHVLLRCEPHPKNCKIHNPPYLTLIAPSFYEIAFISATIHTRVVGKTSNNSEHSTYLFCNSKLVTSFRQILSQFHTKNQEEDGILYLQYADTAPF